MRTIVSVALVVGLALALDAAGVQTQPPKKPGQDKPAQKPSAADPSDADFDELSKPSPWVLAEFQGRVPNPQPDQEEALNRLQDRLKTAAGHPLSTPDLLSKTAADFVSVAAIPPEEPIVLDFVSDLNGALAESKLTHQQFKLLTQQLYIVMNSAALSAAELKALQKEIETLLKAGGGDNDRVQTVLYDIQAINEFIKEPGT